MPKASIVALAAAGVVLFVPALSRAQAPAAAPGAAPTAPTDREPAAATSPTPAPPSGEPAPGAVPTAPPTDTAAPAAADDSAEVDASSLGGPAEPAPQPAVAAPTLLPPSSTSLEMAPPGPRAESAPENAKTQGEPVFAEDWWSHARPILELHGYFRTRAELFHQFSLGRINAPEESLWVPAADNRYRGLTNSWGPMVCTPDDSDDPTDYQHSCRNKTQSSANLRFRLNPELHVSDNLRVISQIDLLDNLVFGSTPSGFANQPAEASAGYAVAARSGYTPLSFFDDTTEPPSAGVNGFKDSVRVKRVWAEYATPVGQLRFGRMPDHFGLGMYHNAGDGYDDDAQSTIDRFLFITNIKPIDLYVGGAWDFPNEGLTSESSQTISDQGYDRAQLDDVDQYSLLLLRQKNPELQNQALNNGQLVLNAGLYLQYRTQTLANDQPGDCAATSDTPGAAAIGCAPGAISGGYVRRGASAWTPDLWLQLLYKRFRFEAEAVTIQGSIENSQNVGNDYENAPGGEGWKINAWGLATQLQQKLLEDRLELGFDFGWASGDPDVDKTGQQGSTTTERGDLGLTPGSNGLQRQLGDDTFSTFRFHPSYRVDLILHRNLLTRVQGTYYFRPSVAYDFLRKPNGQRLGGSVAGLWSRASEFVQAPGHERDLGIELNGSVYFQSKDGVLNDRPGTLGGFFTMLQYGVLFPMDGLGYPADMDSNISRTVSSGATDLNTAQTLRWYLGVFF